MEATKTQTESMLIDAKEETTLPKSKREAMAPTKTIDDNAVLVDADQAAAMAGLHRATVFKLVSSGKFPKPIKLGRATRWVKDELMAWFVAKCPPLAKWERMNTTPIQKNKRAT